MAASRKKRGISRDVMTRSEEVREEQWKYKRLGGDKSFSPSVFSPPLEYGRNSVLATRRGGLPNLLPSRSIFLLFEIALIHAYNILPFLLNLRLQFFIKKKKKKRKFSPSFAKFSSPANACSFDLCSVGERGGA